MEPVKPQIIPERVLEEVRLRKEAREKGIQMIVYHRRQSGRELVDRLMNHTEGEKVVATYKYRPKSIFSNEIARMSQFYGATLIEDGTSNLYQHFTGVHIDARNSPEDPVITIDAEVISIENAK